MSDHIAKHRAEMEQQAVPAIKDFVARCPEYTIDPDQSGSQSVTNYVIFGHHGKESVVFKYFCRDERREREVYALRHFASTGLVPRLLQEDGPRLIVVARIPGAFLHLPIGDESAYKIPDPFQVGHTLGAATATLVGVPLSAQAARDFEARFYDSLTLFNYLRQIIDASWEIHRRVAYYSDAIFADSLASIEATLEHMLAQPRLLYHQDAMNMHFIKDRFSGFFDLEMCRVGTEAMQIGSLWYVLACLKAWEAFTQGFAAVTGRALGVQDRDAARAFAHFLVWRYISRYGDWRGEISGDVNMADESINAAQHRQRLEIFNRI